MALNPLKINVCFLIPQFLRDYDGPCVDSWLDPLSLKKKEGKREKKRKLEAEMTSSDSSATDAKRTFINPLLYWPRQTTRVPKFIMNYLHA